ncbi:MAG: hypothetical protein CMD72_04475 [Gammaproteobacteria bacterium]|nr:hypothetical protein [Gammaproteobacteria bacterium]
MNKYNDKKNLSDQVDAFAKIQPWNHNFILSDGTETRPGNFKSPGKNSNKLERLEPILDSLDISGKRVLDLGCNEGFFSINLAERGASVIGIDADNDRIEKAKFIKQDLAKDLPINYECKNFLSDNEKLENANIILCLGFLHRVPDPITVIKKLSELQGVIIFEWKAEYPASIKNPAAVFSSQPINESDTYGTEYWLLSVDALKNILKRYGLDYTYAIPNKGGKREILVASREPISNLETQNEFKRKSYGFYRLIKECLKSFILIFSSK